MTHKGQSTAFEAMIQSLVETDQENLSVTEADAIRFLRTLRNNGIPWRNDIEVTLSLFENLSFPTFGWENLGPAASRAADGWLRRRRFIPGTSRDS